MSHRVRAGVVVEMSPRATMAAEVLAQSGWQHAREPLMLLDGQSDTAETGRIRDKVATTRHCDERSQDVGDDKSIDVW